jgi:hypothetical protein
MRRFRGLAMMAAVIALVAPARAAAPPSVQASAALEVLGTVTNAARPVSNALVIALNLKDFEAVQVWTSADGTFSLPSLRAGIYKIIAVKQGFAPTITTITPTRPTHRLSLKLDTEKRSLTRNKDLNQQIWELRGSLPPDVLRDLDFALQPAEMATYEIPRLRGEVLSVTGVTNTPANTAYAQTALAVQGRLGDTWQIGVHGNLQRFEDPTDGVPFGGAVAQSSVMSMELRSSPTTSYRVASTQSRWRYLDTGDGEQQAGVKAHNFEFENGPAKVEVRYFAQNNLFRNTSAGSNTIEVGTAMPIIQTRRNDLGFAVRVSQESSDSNHELLRTADLSANGTVYLVPSVILHYGMASRIGMDGQEWAPRTGAELKLTENTSIIGSVLYKVLDRDFTAAMLPSLVFWSDDSRTLPRYAYTVGFVSGKEGKNRFSAIATFSESDDPLRVVFADEGSQFWDGLHIDAGDTRRDVRVAYRRELGKLAVDVAATAGTASPRLTPEHEKVYITGDLQSTFTPTRTTLAVSYRELQQPGENGDADYRTERLHLRMAQSLYLPVDIKLLLGLELAHAENSPYLIDVLGDDGSSRKYIGGLAVNF